MGWLWVNSTVYSLTIDSEFQFHYGMIVSKTANPTKRNANAISIPLWDDCELRCWECSRHARKFQFHYGMIVRQSARPFSSQFDYFNSTMGWLWGAYVSGAEGVTSIFQFHYGMIVRPWSRQVEQPRFWFQFHYGMIVRKNRSVVLNVSRLFQFHYGMIVSSQPTAEMLVPPLFQFHYGMIVRI